MPIERIVRTPQVEIEIRRPDYSAPVYNDSLVVIFGNTETDDVHSTACIAYTFQETLSAPDNPFSLTLTPERIGHSYENWFDRINVRDIVLIKEHGKTRYVGYVSEKHYQARMGDGGPQRVIQINGNSIASMLSTFTIVLDQHILAGGQSAESLSEAFMGNLAAVDGANSSLSGILNQIVSSFFTLMKGLGGAGSLGVQNVIENFCSYQFSGDIKVPYPVAISLYQTGENNLWGVIQDLLTPPFHEMFAQWNTDTNKFDIIIRQTPFEPGDWMALPFTDISTDYSATILQDYSIGTSDSDVKTMYGCFLPGSDVTQEMALTVDQFTATTVKDTYWWPFYGYKPMFVELRFFNRDESESFSASSVMHDLSQTLYNWFHNNPYFLTGTVDLMNYEFESGKIPKIGEKFKFLDGEFYIEAVNHSWSYNGPMTLSLAVARGFKYQNGSSIGPIDQIGQKVGAIEHA